MSPMPRQTALDVRSIPATRHPLEVEAEGRLRHAGYSPLRQLACHIHGRVLTILGRVPSYYMKQVAQSLLLELDGIEAIDNQLDVEPFCPDRLR